MSKEELKPDSRLENISEKRVESTTKDEEKLIEVKKEDTSEDEANEFLVHEKPADEQMHESFDDIRKDDIDKEQAN